MDDDQKALVERMLAAALGKTPDAPAATLPNPGVPIQTPPEAPPLPQMPAATTYPPEVPLDDYEALMVEALSWRIEAAEKTQAILKTEKAAISKMKHDLLDRCVGRLQIDVTKFNIAIDSNTKTVKISNRG